MFVNLWMSQMVLFDMFTSHWSQWSCLLSWILFLKSLFSFLYSSCIGCVGILHSLYDFHATFCFFFLSCVSLFAHHHFICAPGLVISTCVFCMSLIALYSSVNKMFALSLDLKMGRMWTSLSLFSSVFLNSFQSTFV